MTPKPSSPLFDLDAYAGKFVTVPQLADRWRVSRKHVLKLIESGELESVRLGPKTIRVPVDAARAFEHQRESPAKARSGS